MWDNTFPAGPYYWCFGHCSVTINKLHATVYVCQETPLASCQREDQERTVASVCDVCGKGPGFGKSVSHSHVRTNRRWNPNIQRVRALVEGTPKRLNVCTTCIKSDRIVRNTK